MSKSNGHAHPEILLVDDEADIRELVGGILEDEGYEVRTASDGDQALTAVRARRPHLLILDIWLQGSRLDGLQVLDQVRRDYPDLPILVISGHGTIETAVGAIKKGAYDFLEKPFKSDRLILAVSRALETWRLKRENEELRVKSGEDGELIGNSAALNQVRQLIDKVAPTGSRVLISGPPGSGKELVARLLHMRSRRARNAFVVVNCAMMAPDRMEAELFGVEGEDGRRTGMLELAHNGTLFLDEVADLPAETQSKILRVLVEQTFQRVGGGPRVQVDVRVVSATSKNLGEEIEAGRFREDLYHRLNVVPLRVPALTQRREDIAPLIEHFMQRLRASSGLQPRPIADEAMAALQAYSWPGNVRQLRNIVERLLILGGGEPDEDIPADILPAEIRGSATPASVGERSELVISMPLREARELFEREYLVAQINRFGGNISRTASFIGMERSALHRKLKSLGVATNGRDGPDA